MKEKRYAILAFAALLIVIYVGAFFIPERVEKFSLDPEKKEELWRFVTYPFVHLDFSHLIENLIGFSLLAFIAFELKTAFSDFSATYGSSGFLAVLPVWIVMAFRAMGASTAIFGGFGLMSQEVKKYNISGWLIIAALTALTFMGSVFALLNHGIGSEEFGFAFKQGLAHFSGVLFGLGFFFLLGWIKPIITKRKRYALRRSSA